MVTGTPSERWADGRAAKETRVSSGLPTNPLTSLLIFLCFLTPVLEEASLYIFFIFSPFLGPHPRHMEVPRLGVELEL